MNVLHANVINIFELLYKNVCVGEHENGRKKQNSCWDKRKKGAQIWPGMPELAENISLGGWDLTDHKKLWGVGSKQLELIVT